MTGINGWVFVTIGGIVLVWSLIVSSLVFFSFVGGAMMLYGAIRVFLMRSDKTETTPHHQRPVHPLMQQNATVHPAQHAAMQQHMHMQQTQQHQQYPSHPVHHAALHHTAFKVCPNCKKQMHVTYRFCPHCGWGV